MVCSFINTEGLFSQTAASILFPESELTTINRGLECTKDLQAGSVDILKGPATDFSRVQLHSLRLCCEFSKMMFHISLSGELKNHSD